MSQKSIAEKPNNWSREIIETIVLTLLMFLVIHYAVQNFKVDGQSMEPTLHDQEYILVDKATYLFQPPARGDVIVFQYPRDPQLNYVKRIIAIPGDVISVVGVNVTVDGITLQEPYLNKYNETNPFPSFSNMIVPRNDYFVMGDNRGNSSDSRQWGVVPRQNIIGKASLIYWPPGINNLGLLPNEGSVFASIHQ